MGEGEKGVRRALTYDDKLAIERSLTWCVLRQDAPP